jgi:hypothetical protein
MRAVGEHRLEQGSDIGFAYRTERDAATRGCKLDHRFQPVQAARACSDDLNGVAAFRRGPL